MVGNSGEGPYWLVVQRRMPKIERWSTHGFDILIPTTDPFGAENVLFL